MVNGWTKAMANTRISNWFRSFHHVRPSQSNDTMRYDTIITFIFPFSDRPSLFSRLPFRSFVPLPFVNPADDVVFLSAQSTTQRASERERQRETTNNKQTKKKHRTHIVWRFAKWENGVCMRIMGLIANPSNSKKNFYLFLTSFGITWLELPTHMILQLRSFCLSPHIDERHCAVAVAAGLKILMLFWNNIRMRYHVRILHFKGCYFSGQIILK